jgi:hypothetical protein
LCPAPAADAGPRRNPPPLPTVSPPVVEPPMRIASADDGHETAMSRRISNAALAATEAAKSWAEVLAVVLLLVDVFFRRRCLWSLNIGTLFQFMAPADCSYKSDYTLAPASVTCFSIYHRFRFSLK